MTSKPLTPTPVGPVLVKRIVPVVAAASMITGCLGNPGAPGNTDASAFDAGPDSRDAFVEVRDAGISAPLDAAFPASDDDAAITDDAGADDAGPVGDDAD